jgi:hypothetical protein
VEYISYEAPHYAAFPSLPLLPSSRLGPNILLSTLFSNISIYEGVSKSFRTESIKKYTLTTINTSREVTQRVMTAKLTRMTHKIAIQLHLVAQSCTICSSRSRRPVFPCLISVKLTTHLHLVPRLKNVWRYISTPPIRLHGVGLSYSTRITLPFFYLNSHIFFPCLIKL